MKSYLHQTTLDCRHKDYTHLKQIKNLWKKCYNSQKDVLKYLASSHSLPAHEGKPQNNLQIQKKLLEKKTFS